MSWDNARRPRPLTCERCQAEVVSHSEKRRFCDACNDVRSTERLRRLWQSQPRTCIRCKAAKLPAEFRVKRQICIACETAPVQDAPKEPMRPDRPPSWTLRRHLRLLNVVQQEMIAEYGASMCYSCKFLRECQVNVFTGAELPCVEWARGMKDNGHEQQSTGAEHGARDAGAEPAMST